MPLHRTSAELVGGPCDGDVQEVLYFDGDDGARFGVLILPPVVADAARALRYRHSKGCPGDAIFSFDGYE